jgi:outer membrane receptor protein involved in Fe transport
MTQVNLGAGYGWERFRLALTVVNLLDSKDSDIEYFFASKIDPGPGVPVEDVHQHPVAPRQVRATFSARF